LSRFFGKADGSGRPSSGNPMSGMTPGTPLACTAIRGWGVALQGGRLSTRLYGPLGPAARRATGSTASSCCVGRSRKSSRYLGISWNKARSWFATLWDPRPSAVGGHIGAYASEEDAARTYDSAAEKAHGPGDKRNFPGKEGDQRAACESGRGAQAAGRKTFRQTQSAVNTPPIYRSQDNARTVGGPLLDGCLQTAAPPFGEPSGRGPVVHAPPTSAHAPTRP
jgi:hypothetical protein